MFQNKAKEPQIDKVKEKTIQIANIEGGTLSEYPVKDTAKRPTSNVTSTYTTGAVELKRRRVIKRNKPKNSARHFEHKLQSVLQKIHTEQRDKRNRVFGTRDTLKLRHKEYPLGQLETAKDEQIYKNSLRPVTMGMRMITKLEMEKEMNLSGDEEERNKKNTTAEQRLNQKNSIRSFVANHHYQKKGQKNMLKQEPEFLCNYAAKKVVDPKSKLRAYHKHGYDTLNEDKQLIKIRQAINIGEPDTQNQVQMRIERLGLKNLPEIHSWQADAEWKQQLQNKFETEYNRENVQEEEDAQDESLPKSRAKKRMVEDYRSKEREIEERIVEKRRQKEQSQEMKFLKVDYLDDHIQIEGFQEENFLNSLNHSTSGLSLNQDTKENMSVSLTARSMPSARDRSRTKSRISSRRSGRSQQHSKERTGLRAGVTGESSVGQTDNINYIDQAASQQEIDQKEILTQNYLKAPEYKSPRSYTQSTDYNSKIRHLQADQAGNIMDMDDAKFRSQLLKFPPSSMAYQAPYVQYDNSAIKNYLRRGNVNHRSLQNKKLYINQKINAQKHQKDKIYENFQKNLMKMKDIKSRKVTSCNNRSIQNRTVVTAQEGTRNKTKVWCQSLDNDSQLASNIFDSSYNINTVDHLGSFEHHSSHMQQANHDYVENNKTPEIKYKKYFMKRNSINLKTPRGEACKLSKADVDKVEVMLNKTHVGTWRRESIDIKKEILEYNDMERRCTNQALKRYEFVKDLQLSDKFNNILQNSKMLNTDFMHEQIAEEAHQRKFGAQNNFTNFLRKDVLNQMEEERQVNSKIQYQLRGPGTGMGPAGMNVTSWARSKGPSIWYPNKFKSTRNGPQFEENEFRD